MFAAAREGNDDGKQDLHIDIGHPTDEQLKLTLVEHVDELLGDQLGEARHEGVRLLLEALQGAVLDHDHLTGTLLGGTKVSLVASVMSLSL